MTRPVNLKLTAFRFPIVAIASILHRISGVVLLAGVGYLSYLLSVALESQNGFDWVVYASQNSIHAFILWGVLTALVYHLLAGIRHLLLDLHIGDSLSVSRRSSVAVLIVSFAISIAYAVWILL